MPKTIFVSGTYILANWLNSIFGGGAKSAWQANQAYAAGIIIKLSGGEILRCIVAGTSHAATEPTAPGTVRGTVVDNTVTWELFAGHLHDDRAMDGSTPKVLLTSAAEVSGVLPQANVNDLGIWHAVSATVYKCTTISGGTLTEFTPSTSAVKYHRIGNVVTLVCTIDYSTKFAAADIAVKVVLPSACRCMPDDATPPNHCAIIYQLDTPTFSPAVARWGGVDFLLVHLLACTSLENYTHIHFTITYEAF